MKKEKIEKINEENLDDVSGGMYVGGLDPINRPFIPHPSTKIDEELEEQIRRAKEELMRLRSVGGLDERIARLRELEKEVKNMNGVPSASTLEEMLNLRKYVDSFKEKFKDL